MLSVVIASRNDDHGGQMIPRTNTFIRALAAQARKHHIPTELILVEWNPPPERPGLTQALAWPRASIYFRSRVIVVPPRIHQVLENSGILPFYQMIAKNCGIRRARYPWVLATNPDLLFSNEIYLYLRGKLDPGCFYRAVRKDIRLRALNGSLSFPEQLDLCRQNVVRVHDGRSGGLHTFACGDFTLMAREAWRILRGYPEFDLWSIHIDSVYLHWAASQGYKEIMIPGGDCYHLEHHGAWVTNPEFGAAFPKLTSKDVGNLASQMRRGQYKPNGPSWGFADASLPEYTISGRKVARRANLTLYAVPKPFVGDMARIQRNAIRSWLRLSPQPHVVLIGNEEGTAAFARKYGLEHRPDVKVNAHGTPLLDGIMGIVQSATTKYVGLVNADIILLGDFMDAFGKVCQCLSRFLMIGRRTNCAAPDPLDFSNRTWAEDLREYARSTGELHSAGALDYFIFRRGVYANVPPFAIGRTAWDNWLAVNADAMTVDATQAVLAIHQDHPSGYGDGTQSRNFAFNGEEAQANRRMAARHKLGSTNHAQAILTARLDLRDKRGKLLQARPPEAINHVPLPAPGTVKTRRGYTRPLPTAQQNAAAEEALGRKRRATRPMLPTTRKRRGRKRKIHPAGEGLKNL